MPTVSKFFTIEGFPFAMGDASVTSFGSPLTDHPEFPAGVSCFNNGFHPEGLRWTERYDPISGLLSVDTIHLKVNDLHYSTPLGQKKLFTHLTTKFPERLKSTELELSMDDDDMTFTVFDPGYINGLSLPAPVWIDSECILVESINTMTKVATVATGGRGYFGTVASAHIINEGSSYFPEVFVEFPWFFKRKILLWIAKGQSGVITSARIAYSGEAARPEKRDGRWTIAVDHVFNKAREAILGLQPGSTKLRGFNLSQVNAWIGWSELIALNNTGQLVASVTGIANSKEEMMGTLAHDLDTQAQAYESSGTISLDVTGEVVNETGKLKFSSFGVTSPFASMSYVFPLPGNVQGTPPMSAGGIAVATAPIPNAIVVIPRTPGYIPISSTIGLFNSAGFDYELFGQRASAKFSLHGQLTEDQELVIEPITGTTPLDDDNADYNGPTYYGQAYIIAPSGDHVQTQRKVLEPLPLQQVATIECSHAFLGISAMLSSGITKYLSPNLDSRDWNLGESSNTLRILSVQSGPWIARKYKLDGTEKLGELFKNELPANGWGLSIGEDAKIEIFAFRQPSVSEVAVSIPEAELTEDSQDSQTLANDGFIINLATLKAPNLPPVGIPWQQSLARYGQGIDFSVELKHLDIQNIAVLDLASTVLVRLFGVWAHPRAMVNLEVPNIDYDESARIGTWIKYSSAHLPDGSGDEGAIDVIAQVLERTLDYEENKMQVKPLVFPPAFGHSPCLRVVSIVDETTIEIAGPGYVKGTTDYSGSDQPNYAFAATHPNDGGLAWLKVGYVMQFVRRTATGEQEHNMVIKELDFDNLRIEFEDPIPMTPTDWEDALTNSIVDIRFDNFNNCILEQQANWPFVGSLATGLIDGTDTRNHGWGA